MKEQLFSSQLMLENERIRLVPMSQEHSKGLYKINVPETWAYMLLEISKQEQMDEWVAAAIKLYQEKLAVPFVVILKETGQVIGTTRIYELNEVHKSCEIGSTWYGVGYRRTFVNSDCKYLLLNYCFETLKLMRVQLKTDERNVRSQKAIERLGATKEGILRKERILANGYIRNAVLYSITDDDWNGFVKQRFLERNAAYEQNMEQSS
ncbi:MAG: GNAT family N-acetyltransferase [Bacillota bacterium]